MISPEDDAADAFNRLQEKNIYQLPVVTENKIVGLRPRKDIVRWLQIQSDIT